MIHPCLVCMQRGTAELSTSNGLWPDWVSLHTAIMMIKLRNIYLYQNKQLTVKNRCRYYIIRHLQNSKSIAWQSQSKCKTHVITSFLATSSVMLANFSLIDSIDFYFRIWWVKECTLSVDMAPENNAFSVKWELHSHESFCLFSRKLFRSSTGNIWVFRKYFHWIHWNQWQTRMHSSRIHRGGGVVFCHGLLLWPSVMPFCYGLLVW